MDVILHIIGVCPDAHIHLNLMDIYIINPLQSLLFMMKYIVVKTKLILGKLLM